MFGSDVLEIAVGLVLVYLLLSLVMTGVQEAVQQFLKTRAVILQQALAELLQKDPRLLKRFHEHPLIYALHRGSRGVGGKASKRRRDLPSYIPRDVFSAVLLDLMDQGRTADNPYLAEALDGLTRVAGGEREPLRRELEKWYDAAMDRAAGAFKRHAQASLFLMGLAASLALNVNSVTIARHLAVDPQARQLADRMAERLVEQGMPREAPPAAPGAPADAKALDAKAAAARAARADFDRQMEEIGLPVGWDDAAVRKIEEGFPEDGGWRWYGALVTWLLGYLLTALAVMLGAPFWFDVLNRIMVIRSTVKPKEKSPDEPPVDGTKADKARPTVA